MLDMTGKSLLPYDWKITVDRLGTKQNLNIFLKIFFEKKLRKCRIVPKNEKGGPFGIH